MAQLNQFTDVDSAADPELFVEYLTSADSIDGVRRDRLRVIEALRLKPGQRVLDVGCGPGDSTAELAALVGPEGEAVGVDFSATMVATASERHGGTGLPLRCCQGDVRRLDFADGEFDACRCERLLCHVPDATAALAEMVRVTRPGGRVAVLEPDADTLVMDGVDPEVVRLMRQQLTVSLANGMIGRQLPRLLRAAGLAEVAFDARLLSVPLPVMRFLFDGELISLVEAGAITPARHQQFWADAEAADQAGDFYGGFGMFLVAGSRP